MKTNHKILVVILLVFGGSQARSNELYLNGFRNPSIGVEWRIKYLSSHTGYYLTNFAPGETSKFWRTGLSFWPTDYAYLSVSHLYGIDGALKNKHAVLFEAGGQLILFEHLALRLGVAVLPFSKISAQVNPTPGVSVRIPF